MSTTEAGAGSRVIGAVRIFKEIPSTCSCEWQPPDATRPAGERGWILTDPSPACRLHHNQSGAGR